VSARFLEASLQGLDYLAITDHNDVRSSYHVGFGTRGVIGVAGYENSLNGHAQMLGARKLYDMGDKSAPAVNAAAHALRADGGVFQINHPLNGAKWDGACDSPDLDWGYGTEVVPDTLEVWNGSEFQVRESLRYWEKCWLDRGHRVGATGGSDSHWAATTPVQGIGSPTTWAGVGTRWTPIASVLQDVIRRGATSISRFSPARGGGVLWIYGDAEGRGNFYTGGVGKDVPPGAKMRVLLEGGKFEGVVRVRANGRTILEQPLKPGGSIDFTAPAEPGWIRAELWAKDTTGLPDLCQNDSDPYVCPNDFGLLGLTSAAYVR
jgi:hypothetical protein